jgi:hypothetical protein
LDLIKAGEDEKARACLVRILKTDPTNDTAWVWMASVVETEQLRRQCLEEALKHNPRNKMAQRALQKMNGPQTSFESAKSSGDRTERLSVVAHLLCGWPFALAFFGGAIGGGLGGLAYAINVAIYKASMPTILKVFLNLSVGFGAIGIWYVIAQSIQ